MEHIVFDKNLTKSDSLVLQNLAADLTDHSGKHHETKHSSTGSSTAVANGHALNGRASQNEAALPRGDEDTIKALNGLNDPKDGHFEPTVFNTVDLDQIQLPLSLEKWILRPYIRLAKPMMRVPTDVVMLNHLLLYFTTSVPSAVYLFWRFSWLHAVLHFVMQMYYVGTYTLMMHQHIHQRGILNKHFWLFDMAFPYITDPLFGHTWNTYFYHHVKHHHVEANGPNDLSSTITYQRDSILHFLHYVGRFFFLIWLDLPLYFIRKGRMALAAKAAFWELSNYAFIYSLYRVKPGATVFALLLPLLMMRIGLMVGNWGQHAFVDDEEPDSDYRSSITLIDVASNRHCFNDGYHTSHHLNPMRHWREHPVAFMKSKDLYASQHALVFHNIDYIMITVRLMMKDYATLAKCMVPIGNQIGLTLEERAALLRRHTRRFTDEEIKMKFKPT